MQSTGKIKVLFILGFLGPIVRETVESRKLYSENLGIDFKEEALASIYIQRRQRRKKFRTLAAVSGR